MPDETTNLSREADDKEETGDRWHAPQLRKLAALDTQMNSLAGGDGGTGFSVMTS